MCVKMITVFVEHFQNHSSSIHYWQHSSDGLAECHVGEQALPAGHLSQELQGQLAEVRGTVSKVQLSWLEVQVISIPLAKKGSKDSA